MKTTPTTRRLARAIGPPKKTAFEAEVLVGTRRRTLICYAISVLGAKRIAGRFYREMYPDRSVTILDVTKVGR